MAHQLTVRLPDDLGQSLEIAAEAYQRARSEIVRMALRQFLDTFHESKRPAERAQHLLGSLDSGVPDLGENHREYILESLKRGA